MHHPPAASKFFREFAARLCVADKRRPTLMGTCVAARTALASVYGASPVGNASAAGLPSDVAAHLQPTARETVEAFRQPI